jgi:hypothetical protein
MNKINEKIVTFLDPATIEPEAKQQLLNIAELPFVFKPSPLCQIVISAKAQRLVQS